MGNERHNDALIEAWEKLDTTPDLSFIEDETQTPKSRKRQLFGKVALHAFQSTQALEQAAPELEKQTEALVAQGNDALPTLRKALRSPSLFARTSAACTLDAIKTPEATALLLEAYATEKTQMVHSSITYALGQRDDPAIIAPFLATVQKAAETATQGNEALQQNLQDGALGKMRLLAQVVAGNIPGASIPTTEIEALGRLKVREATPAILALLPTATMPLLQRRLIEALGELGDPAALPTLRSLREQAPPLPRPADPTAPLPDATQRLINRLDLANVDDNFRKSFQESAKKTAHFTDADHKSYSWHQANLNDVLDNAIKKLDLL